MVIFHVMLYEMYLVNFLCYVTHIYMIGMIMLLFRYLLLIFVEPFFIRVFS